MNQRSHLSIIAAVATLMGAMPLATLFAEWTWIFQSAFTIALVCAALLAARSLRTPLWAQPIIGFAVLLLAITWQFGSSHAYGRILPDVSTLHYFQSLVSEGGNDMSQLAIPVQDTNGLLFLTVTGIGLCYILIDLFAVGLRRPALAGLPMLAIYAVPVSIDHKSTSLIYFAIAAAGFLWLLVSDSIDRVRLFGRRFTGDGHGLDTWETSPLASVGRRITTVGIVLAIAIPGILPGVGNGFIDGIGQSVGGGTGKCTSNICPHSGTSLDLFASLVGSLKNGTTVSLLNVQTKQLSPAYMQVGSEDVLTASGFRSFTPQGVQVGANVPDVQSSSKGVTYTPYTASVAVSGLVGNLLPLYPATSVKTISGLGHDWSYDSSSFSLFSSNAHAVSKNTRYSFTYQDIDYGNGDELKHAGPLSPTDPTARADTVLPEDVPQVDRVLSEVLPTATDEYSTVVALEHYFSTANGFTYSLDTKPGDAGTDIGNFLDKKQGFCQQYATALAWLVRAAHFPSRVAFGFTEGTQDSNGTWQITNHDLHAWTQVLFPGYGWVSFDATPPSGLAGSYHPEWDQGANGSTVAPPKVIKPSTSNSAAPGGVVPTQKHPTTPARVVGATSKPTPVWEWWLLIGVLIVLLASVSPAIARALVRRRRAAIERRFIGDAAEPGQPWIVQDDESQGAATKRRIHAAWDEFIDMLIDFDMPVDPSETPRTTAERVIRTIDLSDEGTASARMIGMAEEHARYARRPSASPPLGAELRRIRKELAFNMPLSTRLRANLLPPSVVARWNRQFTNTAAGVSARLQAIRDSITSTLQIRRWTSAPRRLLTGRGGR